MTEEKIHSHETDPEAPEAQPYFVTIATPQGHVATLPGMDPAPPRDVARRVADFKRRYTDLVAGRSDERELTWTEPLLEGNEDGLGYVVVHDPRQVLAVSTPQPPLEYDPDTDEDDDEDGDGDEEATDEDRPRLKLGTQG